MSNPLASQYNNRCSELILNLNECFEAVGIWKGKEFCKDIQDDILECNKFETRQRAMKEIYRVRTKKLITGELSSKDSYLPKAPGNSFVYWPEHK